MIYSYKGLLLRSKFLIHSKHEWSSQALWVKEARDKSLHAGLHLYEDLEQAKQLFSSDGNQGMFLGGSMGVGWEGSQESCLGGWTCSTPWWVWVLRYTHLSALTESWAKNCIPYYIEIYVSIKKIQVTKDMSILFVLLLEELHRNRSQHTPSLFFKYLFTEKSELEGRRDRGR